MQDLIDRTIKEVWITRIKDDYQNSYLLLEDSLKNTLYHYLRNALSDKLLLKNNIRIFTELHNEFNERSDIAIVKLNDNANHSIKDRIVEVLAIIELKFKNSSSNIDPFIKDILKTKKYLRRKKYRNCQFYLGFIHETEYELEESSWLTLRQQNSWAKGKITELSGFINEDKPVFTIVSYNNLNKDINELLV